MRFSLGRMSVTGLIFTERRRRLACRHQDAFSCPVPRLRREAESKGSPRAAFGPPRVSFNEAIIATAITYWREAYAAMHCACLLLNLARALRAQDRPNRGSQRCWKTYLQAEPTHPNRRRIRAASRT